MIIGVLKENGADEARVAATPQAIEKLIQLGYEVVVETRSGVRANFPDASFEAAGAKIGSLAEVVEQATLFLKVDPPTLEEINDLPTDSVIICFLCPAENEAQIQLLRRRNITSIAMDCVPGIAQAKNLDALSSMASVAGYRAVVEAANVFGSCLSGQVAAAGKATPAKVLVVGAGAAGQAAAVAAIRAGAVVRVFDHRSAMKDQIESTGAEFLSTESDQAGEGQAGSGETASAALLAQQARNVDIIIAAEMTPGMPANQRISREMVASMKPGSVIVDLAAGQGGHCELTRPNEKTIAYDVSIVGYADLPSRLPTQASNLYADHVANLLAIMTPETDGQFKVNLENVIVRQMTATHDGNVLFPPPEIEESSPAPPIAAPVVESAEVEPTSLANWIWCVGTFVVLAGLLGLAGVFAPPEFVPRLTAFVLACFVGWQLAANVSPTLQTPMISVTNAISGVIVVAAILQIGSSVYSVGSLLAVIAVLVAAINIGGGFVATHRMLGMFRKCG
jgi:NAD(P) transhydrogenase subunit alpha